MLLTGKLIDYQKPFGIYALQFVLLSYKVYLFNPMYGGKLPQF